MNKKLAILATIGAFSLPCLLHAELTINLDIGGSGNNYSGTALAPDSGTFWNNLAPGGTNAMTMGLSDSAGNALSGVNLTFENHTLHGQMYYYTTTGNTTPNPVALMEDYSFFATYDVTITGLAAGNYDFWYYGHGDAADQTGTITFDAANGGATGSTANNANARDLVNGGEGISYDYFTGVSVDGSGVLKFQVADYLNGFQLQAAPVPEPSSLALFGGGVLAFVTLLRRKQG